ncbi:hypothetical protein ERJ70_04625 [Sediminibacillus dalangtanensis]|uniref:Uncharacterized protein n=1 Tax=Sediminibacillus dalangtanensis TaxID=2729421 RepID=A0ABX7VP39_9BACI|nr:hypothetical protein [Sediminibacillus dalangtanensis]QTM98642.1 hypothetical protein ERJ70_04625 [Sediminibacillus dalangtanensis]
MIDFQEQLMNEKEKMREKQNLNTQLIVLAAQLEDLRKTEARMKRRLEDEKVDVEKLEGISLKGVFMTIAGKKEELLDKERQEVLEAQLKWKEARSALEELEREHSRISARIESLGYPEEQVERLLEKKEQYLLEHGHQAGEELLDLSEAIGELRADANEIKEALAAGREASSALSKAEEALRSAENWGTLDMFGGGMITTAVKHGRIDDASKEVHVAQRLLRKFSNELDDIGNSFAVDVSISGGWTVADYFFDGLITDWFIQGQIKDSLEQVSTVKRETDRTVAKLEELFGDVKRKIEELEGNKRRLLETPL